MAIGTYTITKPGTNDTYFGGGQTICDRTVFANTVRLRSIFLYAYQSTGTLIVKPVVYNAVGTKIAEGSNYSGTVSAGQLIELSLTSPVVLNGNDEYSIGYYVPGEASAFPGVYAGNLYSAINSSPSFTSATPSSLVYYGTGDVRPTQGVSYVWKGGYSFDSPNIAPNRPEDAIVVNTPVKNGDKPELEWFFSDPDGNPQARYEIRWRKKD